MPTLCRMRRSKIGRRTSWGWQITLAVIFYNGIREEGERSSKEGEHRPGNLRGERLGGRALKGSATKNVFKSGHKRADGQVGGNSWLRAVLETGCVAEVQILLLLVDGTRGCSCS